MYITHNCSNGTLCCQSDKNHTENTTHIEQQNKRAMHQIHQSTTHEAASLLISRTSLYEIVWKTR